MVNPDSAPRLHSNGLFRTALDGQKELHLTRRALLFGDIVRYLASLQPVAGLSYIVQITVAQPTAGRALLAVILFWGLVPHTGLQYLTA